MRIKTLIILSFLLNVLTLRGNEVEIDARNLESSTPIFVLEVDVMNQIPESGILELNIENLPTIIRLGSLAGHKIVIHKTIWLTGNTLKISGSIDDNTVKLSSNEMGEILADDIEEEWKRVDIDKNPEYISSKPFLVYLANNLKSQKTKYLKNVVKKFTDKARDFWAAVKIITYLDNLESIGFDSSTNQFEYLTAMNKKGEKQTYERPNDKFLLIDYTSTGCRSCLEDIDKLVKLHEDFGNNLEILSVWDDAKQKLWLNIAKEQKNKIVWTSLRDDSRAIFKKFNINVYPTYLLIDPTGQVLKTWKGSKIKKVRRYLKRSISKTAHASKKMKSNQ